MIFCVGLTGGIGCGKSRAADLFAEFGATVVDTDVISRELTGAGGGAMREIEETFGARYVQTDGSLNRAAMRELVFGNMEARKQLEAILHPRIREQSRAQIEAAGTPYAILVVPLLFETGAYRDVVDRVAVVDCDESRQIERVISRSRLTEDAVKAIMATQIERSERLRQADDVISNDADIDTLRDAVRNLHERYVELSRR
jgi:dephospho-CoA kinase